MWSLCLLSALGLAAIEVDVRPATGPAVRGQLVEISAEAVVVQSGDTPQRLAMADLWEITPSVPAGAADQAPAIWIELVDGSQLLAERFTVAAGEARVQLVGGLAINLPTATVYSVRFRDHGPAPKLAEQWAEITARRPATDTLVIRRAENLDHLEGIIRDVTDESVQFEFNGQTIDAKRTKLDGLVYHQPGGKLPDRVAQVNDVSGSRWNVRAVQIVEDRFELTTVAGAKVALGRDQWLRIDFSSGNTVWLDELEPESFQWRPYVASKLGPEQLLSRFHPPGAGGSRRADLVLGGQEFPKGLALQSRMEVVYRLTDDFRRFRALVGIDDSVREGGDVRLVVSGDGRELFAQNVTGRDPPCPLDLDISGVKRLKILVEFGQGTDIADHLNLCDARVTK